MLHAFLSITVDRKWTVHFLRRKHQVMFIRIDIKQVHNEGNGLSTEANLRMEVITFSTMRKPAFPNKGV
jgi:hypothetical protein